MSTIKKGDTVLVLAGKDRGKKGRVLETLSSRQRLLVEGVQTVRKHIRPSATHPKGGVIPKEMPIHRSNVALLCPKCNRPTRLGTKSLEDGRRMRICKKCGETL